MVDHDGVLSGLRTDDLAAEYLPEPATQTALACALAALALPVRRRRQDPRAD